MLVHQPSELLIPALCEFHRTVAATADDRSQKLEASHMQREPGLRLAEDLEERVDKIDYQQQLRNEIFDTVIRQELVAEPLVLFARRVGRCESVSEVLDFG